MSAPALGALRAYVEGRLRSELAASLHYHCPEHTLLDVVPAAARLAALAGVPARDAALLEAGALLHDVGFVERRDGHEAVSARVAQEVLPAHGFSASEVERVVGIILATRLPQSPRTLLEQLMADADLDVLGREDFFEKNAALRRELEASRPGGEMTDRAWLEGQLAFVAGHAYFTRVAGALRLAGKARNLEALRARLAASARSP